MLYEMIPLLAGLEVRAEEVPHHGSRVLGADLAARRRGAQSHLDLDGGDLFKVKRI